MVSSAAARPRVAVCDYGVGNVRSVERALAGSGARVTLTDDPGALTGADGVVLPGVGAFGAASDALRARGLDDAVRAVAAAGKPVFGVCLGHQLLFDWSEESGGRAGLGLIPGRVVRLGPERGKVPHVGWNRLRVRRPAPVVAGLDDGVFMYFTHSYAAQPGASVVAACDYGGELVAVCAVDNVWGAQFHPEKSGRDGLLVYRNFVAACAAA